MKPNDTNNAMCKHFFFVVILSPVGAKNLFNQSGEILRFAQDDTPFRKFAHRVE